MYEYTNVRMYESRMDESRMDECELRMTFGMTTEFSGDQGDDFVQ